MSTEDERWREETARFNKECAVIFDNLGKGIWSMTPDDFACVRKSGCVDMVLHGTFDGRCGMEQRKVRLSFQLDPDKLDALVAAMKDGTLGILTSYEFDRSPR